jgi:hypothetical protein
MLSAKVNNKSIATIAIVWSVCFFMFGCFRIQRYSYFSIYQTFIKYFKYFFILLKYPIFAEIKNNQL